MKNTFKGKIIEIRETKDITDKFQKRQFVVEDSYEGTYGPVVNTALFTLTQERCSLIDQFKVGDKVTLNFDVDGRPWKKDNEFVLKDGEKVYFMDLKAWNIEAVEQASPQDPAAENPDPASSPAPAPTPTPDTEPVQAQQPESEEDDLPF